MFTSRPLEAPGPARHVIGMVWNETRWRSRQPLSGPVLDMTPDGRFADEQRGRPSRLPGRMIGISALVAVLAGTFAVAMLALWLALQLIPIAIGAGLIAYGVFRFQIWRARHGAVSGRQPTQLRR